MSKKLFMVLLFVFFLSNVAIVSQEQIGRPLITNYSYKDYNSGPINWWALEDSDGVMYFANNNGVLQYDGVNWLEIDGTGGARCLVQDENEVIYVGREGDFGYLERLFNGDLKYVSFKDKIPEEFKEFQTVWEVDLYKGRIIFRTNTRLYCWDGETIKVIESEDDYHVGKIVHDTYYLRIWNRGLCYLTEEDTFELVPGGERFADERIYLMLPYDDEKMLVGTRTQGFFIYDGENFVPFKTEIDDLIGSSLYLPGTALENGNFLINTFSNGAYLIDNQGKLIQKYTTENGLQDGSVGYTYLDSRNVMWLMLFNGISSIDLNTSTTLIDSNMGLPSNIVHRIYKHQGILYLGTNNGIYYIKDGENKVKYLEGTMGQSRAFDEYNNRLYAGTGDLGLIEIEGEKWSYVKRSINYDFRVNGIQFSKKDPKRLYVVHNQGFASMYFNENKNQLELESNTDELNIRTFRDIDEDVDGNIWFEGEEEDEIRRLKPTIVDGKMDLSNLNFEVFNEDNGVPSDGLGFWKHDDEIHFFNGRNDSTFMYLFNEETLKFEETEFYYMELDTIDGDGFLKPWKDQDGKIWFRVNGQIVISEKGEDGEYIMNSSAFQEFRNINLWGIVPEEPKPDGTRVVWLNSPDGVFRYQGKLEKSSIPDFKTLIRSVKMTGDSLLFAGGMDLEKKIQIPFEKNNVNIGFAAPLFISQSEIQYKTLLEGLDSEWSEWSKQTSREYINLPPGKYAFKVKSKNQFGSETEEAILDFNIIPPWYKTWWAYILYGIGFLLLVYTIVRSRTRILVNQRKALENKVEERTAEVNQRLEELATVNDVSQALTQKLELGELIKMVGEQMKNLFKSDITYLAILDKDKKMINFPYQDGDSMPPMKYGEGLTSSIIKTGESLLINQDKDISATYDKIGVARTGKNVMSYLGVPIPVEDIIIGVLSVQSTKQASRFTQEDERLLSTIAINVGVALHNAELYEEAKEAKAKAEDANEAKSAFLSTVSHELRTPLTSVLGFAKIIRKRLEDKIFPSVNVEDQKIKRTMKQVSENLNVVVSEGERLTNLINDVLDLAKIESGRMEWHLRPVFLQDVISRAIASTSALFEEKNLKLKTNISPDLPIVSADEDKLIQVVINLLSNAVKFTDKGKVSIEAYLDNGQIMVEVQDTGIGIAEEDKHKIFERFRQAGDTLTDKPKGTGLGLPICREIIEHHGGIIWMKSEHGVGSSFFFTIPTMGESGAEQPIQLDRILNSLKKQIKHSSLTDVKNVPTILVVDDDTPIRSLLRQELGDAGYQVKEAANGKAALDMVRLSKPDLIILDVMMPEINGFDVAAVLKNDPATMDIPIIILSIVQDKERGLKIGVDRYLTKPINTEQLFHEVDELLEQGVSKKKVLVVDEDATAVKTLSEVLSARGYKVMESDPNKLIETATESKPDIIMLNSVFDANQEMIKDLKKQKGMENTMFFIYE
ncbi:response regulator [Lutimonas zeaxanthinifaciens]|uniref:response regulator n=1 Tax=Lutimonas zeaxanthinifaciens TaxID=3060215 RepID=UPI00265D4860|nr:response regulator [Lutimonas sp. YSD2104]WKK65105.1 response regulator [Lutimonas sp. YSD2104]